MPRWNWKARDTRPEMKGKEQTFDTNSDDLRSVEDFPAWIAMYFRNLEFISAEPWTPTTDLSGRHHAVPADYTEHGIKARLANPNKTGVSLPTEQVFPKPDADADKAAPQKSANAGKPIEAPGPRAGQSHSV